MTDYCGLYDNPLKEDRERTVGPRYHIQYYPCGSGKSSECKAKFYELRAQGKQPFLHIRTEDIRKSQYGNEYNVSSQIPNYRWVNYNAKILMLDDIEMHYVSETIGFISSLNPTDVYIYSSDLKVISAFLDMEKNHVNKYIDLTETNITFDQEVNQFKINCNFFFYERDWIEINDKYEDLIKGKYKIQLLKNE